MSRRNRVCRRLFSPPNSDEEARDDNFINLLRERDRREKERFSTHWHYDLTNESPMEGEGNVSWDEEINGVRIGRVRNDIQNDSTLQENHLNEASDEKTVEIITETGSNVKKNEENIDEINRDNDLPEKNNQNVSSQNKQENSPLESDNEGIKVNNEKGTRLCTNENTSNECSNKNDAVKIEDITGIGQSTPIKRKSFNYDSTQFKPVKKQKDNDDRKNNK